MVERAFLNMNLQAKILYAPASMYMPGKVLLKKISSNFSFIHAPMVDRMGEDMAFSHEDARKDFNYNPKPFHLLCAVY